VVDNIKMDLLEIGLSVVDWAGVAQDRYKWRALRSVRRLLVTASVVPSSPILVTLMKEALHSSETSVLTRATRPNIPEDAIPLAYVSSITSFITQLLSSLVMNNRPFHYHG
jgi:hypothetical protein